MKKKKNNPTTAGFEPTPHYEKWFRVTRLNHSAKLSLQFLFFFLSVTTTKGLFFNYWKRKEKKKKEKGEGRRGRRGKEGKEGRRKRKINSNNEKEVTWNNTHAMRDHSKGQAWFKINKLLHSNRKSWSRNIWVNKSILINLNQS